MLENLIALLRRQEFNLQPAQKYWGGIGQYGPAGTGEWKYSDGFPISLDRIEAHVALLRGNQKLVADCVDSFLDKRPYLLGEEMYSCLEKFVEEIEADSGGEQTVILGGYNGLNTASLPFFWRNVANPFLYDSDTISYSKISEVFEQIILLVGQGVQEMVISGDRPKGVPKRMRFDQEGKYVSAKPKKNLVMYKDETEMISSLYDRWFVEDYNKVLREKDVDIRNICSVLRQNDPVTRKRLREEILEVIRRYQ